MIKHYLKIAFRNLAKYKTQNIISIIGLSIGLVCFALSMLWIQYEKSFDNFHSKANRIYIVQYVDKNREEGVDPEVSFYLGEYLKSTFPEIEEATCSRPGTFTIDLNGKIKEFKTLEIDSSFCRVFDISDKYLSFPYYIHNFNGPFISRRVPTAITDKVAKEIFINENPLEKELETFNHRGDTLRVEKIIDAWANNTNIEFDFLKPLIVSSNSQTAIYRMHILLKPNVDVQALSEKLRNIKSDKIPAEIKIVPLTSYKLEHPSGDIKYNHIQLFALSGLLVAFCALFNYLILFLNRIKMRNREFALRKTNGASNAGILALLYTEIFIILIFTFIIAAFVIYFVLPQFKGITGIELPNSNIYKYLLVYTSMIMGGIIILSIIPVYYFQRVTIYKSLQKDTIGIKNLFYKICVLVQLIISIGFIFCTLVLMKQITFLNNTDIGFDRKNIVDIKLKTNWIDPAIYADRIKQIPTVTDVLPYLNQAILYAGGTSSMDLSSWEGKTDDKDVNFKIMNISSNYVDFFGIKILQGKNFNPDILDRSEIIINETTAKTLGWKNPIGKTIVFPQEREKKIIGVIKDFYYEHPSVSVKPIFFMHTNSSNYFLYKYEEGKKKETEEAVSKIILKDHPKDEIKFTYMDDVYHDFLKSENALLKILTLTTIVCIVVSIFGVYSMITLICARRRKEIAIRKVNGASIGSILYSLLSEYITLLVIASVIAFPIGYIIMSDWIENYVQQTEINRWIYFFIFLGILFTISATVFSQVWRASNTNPSEVLKSE